MHRYPFVGTDAVIHIAEEMKQPERNIPIVMYVSHILAIQEARLIFPRILTLTIGFFTAFPLLFAMMLGMTDIDAVIESPFPYAELLYQITGSKLVTTAIMCWVSLVLYCWSESHRSKVHRSLKVSIAALIGQWITCGRLAWAFARDVSAFIGIFTYTLILLPFFLVIIVSFSPPLDISCLSTFCSHHSSAAYLTQVISHTSVNVTSFPSVPLFFPSASAPHTVYCT